MTEASLKPQMKFRASLSGKEVLIYPACPHSSAWFESMGKRTIKAQELHWVGKMGVEMAMVTGQIKEAQRTLGIENLNKDGVLKGKFDMLDNLKAK